MTICVLCQSESLEVTRNRDENQLNDVDLIQFYLPFYKVALNETPTICYVCSSELNKFHEFYSKIEEIYLENLNKTPKSPQIVPNEVKMHETLTIERLDDDYREYQPTTQPRQYRRRAINLSNSSPHVKMSCELCSHPLTSFTDAQEHYKSTHNQRGYLVCCGRKFKQQSMLINHLEFHENPEMFQCLVCDKKLTSTTTLKAHVELHSNVNRDALICDICGRKTMNKYRLTAHMKEAHMASKTSTIFPCEKCQKKFSSEVRLDNHKSKHEEVFKCEICGRELKSSISLKDHLRTIHADVDRIECALCGHFLKNQISMRKHLNRHRQMEQNLKCGVCSKPCTTRAALASHMRMKHILQRTIPCGFCDKKFKQVIDKDEHEATHTGINRYKCEFCGAEFKFGSCYRAHRKKAHPDQYEKIKPRWLRPK